jgi:hypothetical protein
MEAKEKTKPTTKAVAVTNKAVATTNEDGEDNLPSVITDQAGGKLTVEEALKSLASATPGEKISGREFWHLEPGEDARVIFLGMLRVNEYKKQDVMKDAVSLLVYDETTKKARKVVCVEKVVITSLRNEPLSHGFELVCDGEKESANGTYRTYQVRKLDLA